MTSTIEFENAGKKDGLEIWRIENLEMVPVPINQYGQFYTGDSYIVLHTRSVRNFSWDLHFWLGNESSQDEKGAAAILASQLDEHLGGYPVQYRETQNKESAAFRGYFKKGITYKKGGVQSGFQHVITNTSDVCRLLHVKGRRSVCATEVEMSWKSFNKGDIFIVEVGNDIFQWNGSKSNRYERLKACELVNSIKNDEKGGKGNIHVICEKERIPKAMKQVLEGTPDDIGPEISDDEVIVQKRAELFHVSSDTGKLVIEKLGTAPFRQEQLLTGDCYILDNGSSGTIFVWKGKKASMDERNGAMQNALKFIETKNYPPSTKIQVMAEGSESILFIQFFSEWRKKGSINGFGSVYRQEKIALSDKAKFDVSALHQTPKLAAKQQMVDDGSGKVDVWRVDSNGLVPVQRDDWGHFYSEDCYVILYTYTLKEKTEYIIYTWQGLDTTADQISASAIHSTFLDAKYHQTPVQCRVVQGKEPHHLQNIFGHFIIISYGSYKTSSKQLGKKLYQVRSTSVGGTKLIQVDLSASSLNSNDAFLLMNDRQGYIWVGKGASSIEIKAAYAGAEKLKAEEKITKLEEEKETEHFWKILGGKKGYASSPRLQNSLEDNPPKLFAISNARGKICVEEIPGEFTQSDLEPDDIMMLDVWDQVFIWIGNGANAEEKQEASKFVREYIATDPRGRDPNCTIITVKMEAEPVNFTGFFPSWNNNYFKKKKTL